MWWPDGVCAPGYKRSSDVLLVCVCGLSLCSRKKPFVPLAYVRRKNITESSVSFFFFYLRAREREREGAGHRRKEQARAQRQQTSFALLAAS